MVVHVAQWEAVAARWAEDDHTQLQPTEPCWAGPANRLLSVMLQTVQAKELELCARFCMPPLSIARSLAKSLGQAKRSSNAAVIRVSPPAGLAWPRAQTLTLALALSPKVQTLSIWPMAKTKPS